jgi:hypothetical protein
MANIFQLAHIARKAKTSQLSQCRFRETLGFNAELLGALNQEVLRQHGNIFTALVQSGQTQADNVQAMEQIFPETALFDALLQVLVRRGDDPNIGFDRRVTADAIKMTIAEHTQ